METKTVEVTPEMTQTKTETKKENKPGKSYTGLTLGFIGSIVETVGIQGLWFIISLLLVTTFGWYTLLAIPIGVVVREIGDYFVARAAKKEYKVLGCFRNMFNRFHGSLSEPEAVNTAAA